MTVLDAVWWQHQKPSSVYVPEEQDEKHHIYAVVFNRLAFVCVEEMIDFCSKQWGGKVKGQGYDCPFRQLFVGVWLTSDPFPFVAAGGSTSSSCLLRPDLPPLWILACDWPLSPAATFQPKGAGSAVVLWPDCDFLRFPWCFSADCSLQGSKCSC